jgi:cytochrome c-type biogenesis protein CcsB
VNLDALFGAHPFVAAVAALHGGALLVSAPGLALDRKRWTRIGLWLLAAAFVLNTAVIAASWIDAGRPPFKTLFETMLFYPWCVGLVALVLIWLHKLRVLVPFASAISIAGLAYALLKPDAEVLRLPPALQSAWFVPHVVTYFIAYSALFMSGALAVVALAARRWRPAQADELALKFQQHAHRATVFGLAALTLGLFMGGLWAKYAWGDYWSWDPKENWALVTWLAYMVYLHLRLMDGWSGRRAMWVLVAAFAAVVFTYLGMSMLPTAKASMHVYQ